MTLRVFALALLFLPAAEAADRKRVLIAFTGDNGGEINHCGCVHNPTGGLPRRKTVIDGLKGRNPVVVDVGNGLFRSTGVASETDKARAQLIMSTLGLTRVAAMAVGPKDLSAGYEFLRDEARKANVPLLSANLDFAGTRPFVPSVEKKVGPVKAVFIGLSAPGNSYGLPGVTGAPPGEALEAELQRSAAGADLVVVLAALPYADALQLATRFKGRVNAIIQSGDARGPMPMQAVEDVLILSSGARGREVGTLELGLDGRGPFLDLDSVAQDETRVKGLEANIGELKRRLAESRDPQFRSDIQNTLTSLTQTRDDLNKRIKLARASVGRTARLTWTALDPKVADDPALRAQVTVFEPNSSVGH